jgi:MFS family permease
LDLSKHSALGFIVLMGVVSLFADVTYEGARSSIGPFLAELGANGTIVSFVAGFGELVGYGLRFVSGYLVDRSKRYWTITIIGYAINLLAVPLLALAGHWQTAAALIVLERLGKAIRVPARDAMLSYAGQRMGRGRAFGIHESLDRLGAMLGPLIMGLVLYLNEGFRFGFALLLIPALISLSLLFTAQRLFPEPENLEIQQGNLKAKGMDSTFWLYVLASACVAAGYADFPLIAYHFVKKSILQPAFIPFSYALAMGISSLTALILGRLYDRIGFSVLIVATLCAAFFAPLAFLGDVRLAILGVCLWGFGMGAHESIMKAVIANMVPANRRGSAYGIFNMMYGISWFIGSALMGVFYDTTIEGLIYFSVGLQLIAVPLLWIVMLRIAER